VRFQATLLCALAACSDGGGSLLVDVRTDFRPEVEFDSVRVRILPERDASHSPAERDDWLRGVRVARFDGLGEGDLDLEVALLRGGIEVIGRDVRARVRGETGITVALLRSCLDVSCPDATSGLEATVCVDGRCAPPECTDGSDDARCPEEEGCEVGACPRSGVACAPSECIAGRCYSLSTCDGDAVCEPTGECSAPSPTDAGPPFDAGPARPDAGSDAGSGSDAGVDGGAPTLDVLVLGQVDVFRHDNAEHGVNLASQVQLCGGRLVVSDLFGRRVLVWNEVPVTTTPPDLVLGQPDVRTLDLDDRPPDARTTGNLPGVHCADDLLFVPDETRHRVLVWNPFPTESYQPADLALGQPDLESDLIGTSRARMNRPTSVVWDGDHLAVTDADNDRILIWNGLPMRSGQLPDLVIGQPSFDVAGNMTASRSRFGEQAWGLASDGSRLVAAVTFDNRVLIWDPFPTTSGEPADVVLGQPDFTSREFNEGGLGATSLGLPRRAEIAPGGEVLISDSVNDRILVWDAVPTVQRAPADTVLGRESFTSSDLLPPGRNLDRPFSMDFGDDGSLWISEFGSSRVVVYDSLPTTDGAGFDRVYFQPDASTHVPWSPLTGISCRSLSEPRDVAVDGDLVAVADGANRVLLYEDGATCATTVLGQSSPEAHEPGLGADRLDSPRGVALNATHVAVADHDNHRVVLFERAGLATGDAATLVVGQDSFDAREGGEPTHLRRPEGVYLDDLQLVVADTEKHRVLVYDLPLTSGQAPDLVLGQADLAGDDPNRGDPAGAATMRLPRAVFVDRARGELFVADSGNARVLVFTLAGLTTGGAATRVIGQASFSDVGRAVADDRFRTPQGLVVVGDSLFVSDEHRVLRFDADADAGDSALAVFGQVDDVTNVANGPGFGPEGLNRTQGLASDGARLWVADGRNDRALGYLVTELS